MITGNKQLWRQLSLPVVPMPVYALAVNREQLWAGGLGGVASYALTGTQEELANQWEPGVAALPLSAVTALLALDEVLLAGGSEGIACSYDRGQSWRQAELDDGLASITALAASPDFAHDRRALAATLATGILRTDDGGRTWMNASFGLESLEVNALCWADQATVLAATSAGIYRSRDAGRSWRRLYESVDGEGREVEALAVHPAGTLLAALASGELLLSRDNGKHWEISLPEPGAQALSLCVTATGALLYGTLEHGLLRSEDVGKTWQTVYTQAIHTGIAFRSRVSAESTEAVPLYIGSDIGVSVSYDDGCSWRELSCPPLHDLRHVLARQDHLLLTGIYTGAVEATSAQTWRPLEDVPPLLGASCFLGQDLLLLSTSAGLEQRSLTSGARSMLLAGEKGQVAYIAQRQVNEALHLWVSGVDGASLLHSADGGEHWSPLDAPFGVLPLVALEAVAQRLVAATYDPRQQQVCLWYSHDEGKSWIRSLEAATRWPIVATCKLPAAVGIGNILFLEQEAWRWQQVVVPGNGSAIRRVLGFERDGPPGLLVLTTGGIQRSDDLGQTWQPEHDGLPLEQIVDLAYAGKTLSVLLTGGRVWQRDLL